MCLGEVLRVVAVDGPSAVADRSGVEVPLSLVTLERHVGPGDWVLAHSGFALEVLDEQRAADALALRAGVTAGLWRDTTSA